MTTTASETTGPAERYDGFPSIAIEVCVRIGTVTCSLGRLLSLEEGEVIALDRTVGSHFDLIAGGKLLAHVQPVASDVTVVLKVVELPSEEDRDGRG